MTIDRPKIDEIFRKRLSAYEVNPPYEVWEEIGLQMMARRKARERRMYVRIAASIIVLITTGTLFFTQFNLSFDKSSQSALSETENQSFRNFVEEPSSQPPQATEKNNKSKPSRSSGPVFASDDVQSEKEDDASTSTLSGSQKSFSEATEETTTLMTNLDPLITGVSSSHNTEIGLMGSGTPATNDNDFIPDGHTLVVSEVSKVNHFTLKATMAPVMSYRKLQDHTSRVNYNTSESELFSYSGGVDFGYQLSNRLSVHSGFYYSQVGQTVSKILLGARDFAKHDDETFVRLTNSLGQVEVESSKLLSAKPPEDIENIVNGSRLLKFSYKLDASVVQRFEYVKIPLMLEYTMIDKQIDLNLVGGLNSNFLVNEGVYLKNESGNSRLIGSTADIKQFNYSGSVGLGLEYNLTDQVNMYLEPHMDYFLHPINYSETKTYPYSFAVYTGLSVTF